ncbi:hypothetical protein PUNSTDRAFT_146951 [Punctularia strigosozonata HHB-11173 SS5]|uniref:Exonuclease domain-containing protein n=1 Tax=Punctularia strigosozonata (strain HHB-11173) TaxID=741275 RepID=R7S2Z1_PUNST|nr:uncharacterized protein PUNSTDRAFT_146951 [Punctularia strigosozonata HHB-11173 SS5]EIN03621.1 hypothetical protein PUNSTDRAFT_146951 [Punctularia strigosozonata HHB-11173 SS5]
MNLGNLLASKLHISSPGHDVTLGKTITEFRGSKQTYDALLVIDVEATCQAGTDFAWPNEIIEWPVCLMRWMDKDGPSGVAKDLRIVDEFRAFVKPTWRPVLSKFCTELTGIEQADVDSAPTFPEVLASFRGFLVKNGLLDAETDERLCRFCFSSDGPWDLRDFLVKQCFISKIDIPPWIPIDFLDTRIVVQGHVRKDFPDGSRVHLNKRARSPSIVAQLRGLGLEPFAGRQHCGIDDARNVARILAELGRRGAKLQPNSSIDHKRRWPWMGKKGLILEEYIAGAP